MAEKTIETPTKLRFASQWAENDLSNGQVFTMPSCTVPDQSLTIPEIIAKFTRSGLVPASFKMADQGGNVATDPESDPLDDWNEVKAAAAAAKAAKAASDPAADPSADPSGGSGNPAPAPAGA